MGHRVGQRDLGVIRPNKADVKDCNAGHRRYNLGVDTHAKVLADKGHWETLRCAKNIHIIDIGKATVHVSRSFIINMCISASTTYAGTIPPTREPLLDGIPDTMISISGQSVQAARNSSIINDLSAGR